MAGLAGLSAPVHQHILCSLALVSQLVLTSGGFRVEQSWVARRPRECMVLVVVMMTGTFRAEKMANIIGEYDWLRVGLQPRLGGQGLPSRSLWHGAEVGHVHRDMAPIISCIVSEMDRHGGPLTTTPPPSPQTHTLFPPVSPLLLLPLYPSSPSSLWSPSDGDDRPQDPSRPRRTGFFAV